MIMLAYLSYVAALIGIQEKIWKPMISYLAYNARTLKKSYKLSNDDVAVSDITMLLVVGKSVPLPSLRLGRERHADKW